MIGGINTTSYQLASLYNVNNSLLANTLSRIASGKKVNSPSDGFSSYIRAQNYQQDISGFELVRENLLAAKVYTDTAVSVGQSIYDDLVEMSELDSLYDAGGDADVLLGIVADFNALRDSVVDAIDKTFVDGNQIVKIATITTVSLDPDAGGSLAIAFTAVPNSTDIGNFDVTLAPAIAAEITDTRTFLSEAEYLNRTIDRQLDVIDTIIESKQAAKSIITDIDDAEEQANLTAFQVRTQASLAMVAQANLNQSFIAALYGF